MKGKKLKTVVELNPQIKMVRITKDIIVEVPEGSIRLKIYEDDSYTFIIGKQESTEESETSEE